MDSLLRTYQKIQTVLKDPKSLDALSEQDKKSLLEWLENAKYNWELNARPEQRWPEGDWNTFLLLMGRGGGKTRAGAEAVREGVVQRGYRAVGFIAPTASDARDTMIDGKGGSSLLEISHPSEGVEYFPTKRRVQWSNGATGNAYSAEEPERLRGPQSDLLWMDELCLAAGTMVSTCCGQVPIEELGVGDLVWTRVGLRRVVNHAMTNPSAEVFRLLASDGSHLIGTGSHPVFVQDRGWTLLADTRPGDRIISWDTNEFTGTVNGGTSGATTTKTERAYSCTGQSMKSTLAQSLMGGTCTTSTTTKQTMTWRTLLRFLLRSTRGYIQGATSLKAAKKDPGLPRNSGQGKNQGRSTALGAAPSSTPLAPGQSSATPIASSQTLGTGARLVESVVKLPNRQAVYNIEVEDQHEYFANGFLTHNCSWRYLEDTWDMAAFGLRLGKNPKRIITTTPKPNKLITELKNSAVPYSEYSQSPGDFPDAIVISTGSTMANRDNLAPQFLAELMKKYEGTRLGRQEIYAEILDDNPNALFSQDNIDSSRVERESGSLRSGREVTFRYRLSQGADRQQRFTTTLEEIVVAVDPSMSSDVTSDETGIIVMALGKDGHLYVLEDASGVMSPNDWATRVVRLYEKYHADCVVAEVNQGGDLVENTIRTVEKSLSSDRLNYKKVRASRGKVSRAEPVAAMVEQGRVHHVDDLPKLEDQLVTFSPGYQRSPDRLDAYVWGAHHLSVQRSKKGFFIF